MLYSGDSLWSGKRLGQHPLVEVAGVGCQDAPGFGVSAGGQGQAGQGDHRVAPPVAEPGVTGQDRAGLTNGGVPPPHQKLVGRQDKLGAHRVGVGIGMGEAKQVALALLLLLPGPGRGDIAQLLAGRLAADQHHRRPAGGEGEVQVPGKEEVLLAIEAALALAAVEEAPPPVAGGDEDGARGADDPPRVCPGEGGDRGAGGDRAHVEAPLRGTARLVMVVPIGGENGEAEAAAGAGGQVAHAGSRAGVRHPDRLLQGAAGHGVAPGGTGALQAERLQVRDTPGVAAAVAKLVGAQSHGAVAPVERLVELGAQHGAAQRRRQGGDQQAVVAAGVGAGQRTHRVGPQPVGAEPLAVQRRVVIERLQANERRAPLRGHRCSLRNWRLPLAGHRF